MKGTLKNLVWLCEKGNKVELEGEFAKEIPQAIKDTQIICALFGFLCSIIGFGIGFFLGLL